MFGCAGKELLRASSRAEQLVVDTAGSAIDALLVSAEVEPGVDEYSICVKWKGADYDSIAFPDCTFPSFASLQSLSRFLATHLICQDTF